VFHNTGTGGTPAICLEGNGATIEHNVFRGSPIALCIDHDSNPHLNVVWRSNIQDQNPTVYGTSTYASGSPNYNLCTNGASCAGANSINGTPTYVGGATPSTYAGWFLTGGSTGHNAGHDGTDMGLVP